MEKINNLLDGLYSNNQNLMIFYIVLSGVALFFIILIIITLIKSSKENKKNVISQQIEKENKKNDDVKMQEEEIRTDELSLEEPSIKEELMNPEELENKNVEDNFYLEPNTPVVEEMNQYEDSSAQMPMSKTETEDNKETIIVSNDELKSRLASLDDNATNNKDEHLEDLMKAVGLEDTMIIPKLKDEEDVLGK